MRVKVLCGGIRVKNKSTAAIGLIEGWAVDAQGNIQYIVASTEYNLEKMEVEPSSVLERSSFDVLPNQGDLTEEFVEFPSSIFGSIVSTKSGSISGTAIMLVHYIMGKFYVAIQTSDKKFTKIPIGICVGDEIDKLSPEQRGVQFLGWKDVPTPPTPQN